MIDWKQRLYAFLLRRVLGPLLDASSAQQLHDSIDVSLQEGKIILRNINIDASHLTKKLSDNCPGLVVRSGSIDRLEISLTLRENYYENENPTRTQSSLAWRAMKLGSLNESLPAVSLVAESKIDGIFLELETANLKSNSHRKRTSEQKNCEEETFSKNVVSSYIEAALATLQLNLKLTNIHIKFCHQNESSGHKVWVRVKVLSLFYNDLDVDASEYLKSPSQQSLVNKTIEFSEITVCSGEELSFIASKSSHSVVAFAEGNGQIFLRLIDRKSLQQEQSCGNHGCIYSQSIEVMLNHQLNFSLNNHSLSIIQQVLLGFNGITEASKEPNEVSIFRQSSMMNNPHMESTDFDREDLITLTGIMRQYREAYHMAEQKQIRGGILVPSNAYLDEEVRTEEIDDEGTFDLFFDANDQSVLSATSTLMESTHTLREHQRHDHCSDHICTKLQINLLSACFKVNFRNFDHDGQISDGEEYILATLNDISLSMLSTHGTNEIELNVMHIQVEDAFLAKPNWESGQYSQANNYDVKIGSILGWSERDRYEEDNTLVSETPCLNLKWRSTRNNKMLQNVDINITLLPLELFLRERSLANVLNFATIANDEFKKSLWFAQSSQCSTSNENAENSREITFSFDCLSFSLYLPLMERITLSPIFEGCAETSTCGIIRESSIGAIFENFSFELKSQYRNNVAKDQAFLNGKALCQYMGLFAIFPGEAGKETHMFRKDIVVTSGRMEVKPSIPISFEFIRTIPSSSEGNPGRESFPIVPAISSFKARQEDDDDIRSMSSIFSKVSENISCSRKELRGSDPQIKMLANAEKSTIIFTIKIPEIIIDLTTNDLETFVLMLKRIDKSVSHKVKEVPARKVSQENFTHKISVAVNLDKSTISIRDSQNISKSTKGKPPNKIHLFLLAMDTVKSHLFFEGSELMHMRLFSQDLCLYSSHRLSPNVPFHCREKFLKGRFKDMKNSVRACSKVSTVPILFRSQLFTPISQDTPSILLDFIDLSIPTLTKKNKLQHRRLYVTIYHLTYRYEIDSNWIERLSDIVSIFRIEAQEDSQKNFKSKECIEEEVDASVTRIFISFADVSIDYKSPSYFETVSKSIIRIGDFRLSSNKMNPAGMKQSYNVSIGDVTYHIKGDLIGNEYIDENRGLCRSSLIMKNEKIVDGQKKSLFGTMPEAILRELDFVNIVSLDAIDIVVTQRIKDFVARNDTMKDPIFTTIVTAGTLSIHACKDSFFCFSNSIGELQSKLVGLTDNDVESLKKKSSGSIIDSKPLCDKIELMDDRYLMQGFKIPSRIEDRQHTLLLDGHEWTTVKKDVLPGLVIPPGDEQISGWYNTDLHHTRESILPSQIFHQHFQFYATTDPLSEGDLGAETLIGESEDLCLKSRLCVQKLNLKIRLFDGYDWPEKCSAIQKKAMKKLGKTFVIEPLPESDLKGNENEDVANHRSSTKARLMEELLDPEDHSRAFFEELPLPGEKASIINREYYIRLSKRRSNIFCQISLNGVGLRMDSYQESINHRLQSILEVAISNLFIAETVSNCKPIKMIGEWSNDYEHPRDTRLGMLMLSMTTWAPVNKITELNEIASEECNVTVQLTPMRCLLDQRAISFVKAYFINDDIHKFASINEKDKWSSRLHLPPPPTLKAFKVKPWKVKVDYYPTRIDVTALREGSIVELVNLSPIHGMTITLGEVVVLHSDGFGPAISDAVSSWIEEICSTQLHKFLANARPFEPFTEVGQGLTDLVILPYEAFKQGESVKRAMTKGIKSLAETVAFQALATTSGLTKMAAELMADSLGLKGRNDASDPLPSRPLSIPKGVGDARLHAARSLARGVSAANYKVVIVPYREYLRNGVTGAVTGVMKGIPVLLVAPLTGAAEAASYTLLGARNALRPDLRKEEEASIL